MNPVQVFTGQFDDAIILVGGYSLKDNGTIFIDIQSLSYFGGPGPFFDAFVAVCHPEDIV